VGLFSLNFLSISRKINRVALIALAIFLFSFLSPTRVVFVKRNSAFTFLSLVMAIIVLPFDSNFNRFFNEKNF